MTKAILTTLIGATLGFTAMPALAQTTRPAGATSAAPAELTGAALGVKATAAFNRGEFSTALPMLRKMAAELDGQPATLGPIQERIRVCEKALASLKNAPPPPITAPPAIPTAEHRKPHAPAKAGETLEMTIQQLGNFEYDQEKGGNIPADVVALTGDHFRLRGFMIPMDQAENITQFALVPSLFNCCIGQPPQIQHTVVATCPKGKAVGYSPDELVVEGTLKVAEKKDDGYIVSVFEMEVTSVRTAPK